ncbi:MAG: radical SAM protein [Aquificae bacterium]|nr:radical SAM protein [Aquificota bacterium]
MLRITEYIKEILQNKEARKFDGRVLIWNLTNICNLNCKHCYSSANQITENQLSYEEVIGFIPQLKENNIKIVILSGGEPLLRKDIFDIAKKIREEGIVTYLSTNGLLIDGNNIHQIKETFNYVGISIDGKKEIHDLFRGRKGAYEGSLKAVKLCLEQRIKVGLRFTLSPNTYDSLKHIFQLAQEENIPKIYISHLVYSGRGQNLSELLKDFYKKAVDYILEKSFFYVENDIKIDVVTGNNEADAVYLYLKFKEKYPEHSEKLYKRLKKWGGNRSGDKILNIDFQGNVKPDTFYHHSIGNIREKPLKQILEESTLIRMLNHYPRILDGKCANCKFIDICNGSSRPRAFFTYGSYKAEDPACYI